MWLLGLLPHAGDTTYCDTCVYWYYSYFLQLTHTNIIHTTKVWQLDKLFHVSMYQTRSCNTYDQWQILNEWQLDILKHITLYYEVQVGAVKHMTIAKYTYISRQHENIQPTTGYITACHCVLWYQLVTIPQMIVATIYIIHWTEKKCINTQQGGRRLLTPHMSPV